MAIFKKVHSILRRLKRDESGVAALSWAVSITVVIGAMGAAMDLVMLTSADARSQTIADTTALAAAIYVKNYEQIPQDREKGLVGRYTADELGYDYRDWVIDGPSGVTITVTYDDVEREATATVLGYTRPTLMQILGFEQLRFRAKTVVKYYETAPLDPASIVMILDNSGSMAFDDLPIDADGDSPTGAQRRMDGLISSAKNFMTILDDHVGDQDGSTGLPRVLRTGMLAFDDKIITARTVPMNWGVVANGDIENMEPLEATNSAPPLVEAGRWLNEVEPAFHSAENPNKTPLKYIILMTDGKNSGNLVWVAREGTESWRAWKVVGSHTEYRDETTTTTNRQIVNRYIYNANCAIESGYTRDYYWYNGRQYYTTQRVLCDVETTTTVQVAYEVDDYDWVYEYGSDEPNESGNWEEGEFDVPANIQSRAECDALHAAGVEIFTIGFALVPGQFETNEWANRENAYTPYPQPYDYENSVKSTNLAKGLLQYCASSDENFITADDSASLEAAFQKIGNNIVKEIIRLSS